MVVLGVLLGFILGGTVVLVAVRKRLFMAPAVQAHEDCEYKKLWNEAVSLLGTTGQLTSEQIAAITPAKPTPVVQKRMTLKKMPGHSADRRDMAIARIEAGQPPVDNMRGMHTADRRDVEIARAEAGQPPVDDLQDMHSADVRDVHIARIQFANRQKQQ